MLKQKLLIIIAIAFAVNSYAQKSNQPTKPKLVIGIVVDQMRWDFLYRYTERYGNEGFKRMLNEGFEVENTYINHTPSKTAVGHATIFTGSVPALHGITGNSWVEHNTYKSVYCMEDSTVSAVGVAPDTKSGRMSPRNLLVNTITDELRLATNFRSKVVGISFKDRAAILPAGHAANGAFWYDDNSARFITSSYYMKELPVWVNQFNDRKEPEKLMSQPWNTLYPIQTYKQSSRDNAEWEGKFKGQKTATFPYDLPMIYKAKKSSIRATPFGNDLTISFAKAAIEGYKLGMGVETDFLTINFTSTDAAGHQFGPNSIEVEDIYLRLDKSLGQFLKYLDTKFGKGGYLLFLTADHGGAHSLDFLEENKIPNGQVMMKPIIKDLNKYLFKKFNVDGLVKTSANYSLYFDLEKLVSLDFDSVKQEAIYFLERLDNIQFAVDVDNIGKSAVPEPIKTMIANGNNRKRTGQIYIVPNAGYFEADKRVGTTHGTWNPYDTHLPLIFMGWGIKHGSTQQIYHQNDIAITVANLLKIQVPNGNIGKPILELFDK